MLFSGLHDALYVVFGRLTRPVLNEKFVLLDKGPPMRLHSRFDLHELAVVISNISCYWDAFNMLCEDRLKEADALPSTDHLTEYQAESLSLKGLFFLLNVCGLHAGSSCFSRSDAHGMRLSTLLQMVIEGLDLLYILNEEPQRMEVSGSPQDILVYRKCRADGAAGRCRA